MKNIKIICLFVLLLGFSFPHYSYSQKGKAPAPSYYDIGVEYFNAKKYKEADSFFSLDLATNTMSADAYYNRGICRIRMKDEKGFCSDMKNAANYGDKEASSMYLKSCALVDTLYFDSLGNQTQNYVSQMQIKQTDKYDNSIKVLEYGHAGLEGIWFEENGKRILTHTNNRPQFPGGEKALQQYLDNNFKFLQSKNFKGHNDLINISFIVNEEGKAEGIENKGGDYYLGLAIADLIKDMPTWKPATVNGKPMPFKVTMYINYKTNPADRF